MTKAGYVYVLINPTLDGLVKIGRTQRDPAERVAELSAPTGVPTPYYLAYKAQFADCSLAEQYVHEKLAGARLSDNREFFKVGLDVAIEALLEAKRMLPNGESGETAGDESADAGDSSSDDSLCDELDRAVFDTIYNRGAGPAEILDGVKSADKALKLGCIDATEYGDALMFVVDWMLDGERGFLTDSQQAITLLKRAATAGYIEAYRRLGELYRDGEKVRQDLAAARRYFWEGVKLGDDTLWLWIARTYIDEDLTQWQTAWKNYFACKHFLSPDTNELALSPSYLAESYLLDLDQWRRYGQLPQAVDRTLLEPVLRRAMDDVEFRTQLLSTPDAPYPGGRPVREQVLEWYDPDGDGYFNTAMSLLRNL